MTCKEGIYKNVNLPTEDVLRLLKVIRGGSRRAGGDLVETGGQVGGGVGCLSANGVEVGNGGVLALREGNEFVAGALEDGKRDQVGGHFRKTAGISRCCLFGLRYLAQASSTSRRNLLIAVYFLDWQELKSDKENDI